MEEDEQAIQEFEDYMDQQRKPETVRKTKRDVKSFIEWLRHTGTTTRLEEIEPSTLDLLLGQYLMSARRKDGEEFEPGSLVAIFSSVKRYMESKGYPEDLGTSRYFDTCKKVLQAKIKQLKSSGYGNQPNKADGLTPEDEEILWEKGIMGNQNARALRNALWFLTTKLLGVKGRNEARQLQMGDLEVKSDMVGDEYLEFTGRQTKTCRGDSDLYRTFVPKMWRNRDKPARCPIFLYKEYLSRRPAETKVNGYPFFLSINHHRKSTDSIWYARQPMGINELSKVMKKMALEAGLQGKLTNHSVRRAACNMLLQANVPPNIITQLSGHRNLSSLKHYGTASMNEQKHMCNILTGSVAANPSGVHSEASNTSGLQVSEDTRQQLASSEFFRDVVLEELPRSEENDENLTHPHSTRTSSEFFKDVVVEVLPRSEAIQHHSTRASELTESSIPIITMADYRRQCQQSTNRKRSHTISSRPFYVLVEPTEDEDVAEVRDSSPVRRKVPRESPTRDPYEDDLDQTPLLQCYYPVNRETWAEPTEDEDVAEVRDSSPVRRKVPRESPTRDPYEDDLDQTPLLQCYYPVNREAWAEHTYSRPASTKTRTKSTVKAPLARVQRMELLRYEDGVAMDDDMLVEKNPIPSSQQETHKGLVIGIYKEEKGSEVALTRATQNFQAKSAENLSKLITISGLQSKGKCRVFYGLDEAYPSVAVVSLGRQGAGFNEVEDLDEGRENVRAGVAAGVRNLQENGVKEIDVDPCGDPEAAAEGAYLASYFYDELKSEENKKTHVKLNCFTSYSEDAESTEAAWQRGVILAEGQLLAKRLMEMPSNHLTPTRFAEIASETIGKLNTCEVVVRDRAWAEEKKMGAFLSVTRGSAEPPRFVELHYQGGRPDAAPFAMVGKGITFDTGGTSLKPAASMEDMRADMGGAACTLGAMYTAARLKLPINIRGFLPLCENMPGGKATKPGDVVTSMSGKTIQIDNTDAEGRLILSDALTYAQTFKPSGLMDMATLTGAIGVALGASASGVFSNNTKMWEMLHQAGTKTGDRVWRMPLFNMFSKQIKEQGHLADVNNITHSRLGGSCSAAAFLREFVKHDKWMHLDIAAVANNKSEISYLGKGMTGRPTRTVVEFLNQLSRA